MSTIASPREPSSPFPRRVPSQSNATPTSSNRPSLDLPRSAAGSPSPTPVSAAFPSPGLPGGATSAPNAAGPGRRNRAALREYYNLRSKHGAAIPPTPSVEVTEPEDDGVSAYSEVPASEMDKDGFDPEAFIAQALAEKGLDELLRLYTRVLGETRALDAEKKALVYDNYSKLIAATETIRKMRTNMDPLNPMASTLDPAIAQIYTQASQIRDNLRKTIPAPDEATKAPEEAAARRTRTKKLALAVLETPAKLRELVSEGRAEEARQAWKLPKRLLLSWKEQEVGGVDVDACLQDGEAALRGEPSQFDWRKGSDDQEDSESDDE
ncbi:Vps51/Vps67-domain-containing protein [Microdochium trichocladiopsis]|uniref:Vacuolar protein sorting-associated protein 51 homolog n=1 Tax=Microdochium trichocladiopsis TaxID=1682393 RepID=A0A9P8Y3I6_9PEZI|nr:Vps51/Vps67-domain-containing protein [Microdochium trichocladiopsis]KAH7029011.1 Vps51/Vps67-domain-containing protein [Microdochium trichocladiopsis]